MGEKGNVTSEELAASAAGVGVLATGTTHVTAVLKDGGEKVRDALIDKGAEAVAEASTERFRRSKDDDVNGDVKGDVKGDVDGDPPTP